MFATPIGVHNKATESRAVENPGCDDLGRPLCRSGLFRVMDHIAQNFRAANPRSLPGSAECQGWKSSKVFISGELSHVGILSNSSRPHRGLNVHSRIAWHEFKHAGCCFCDSHCRSLTSDVCATLRLRWSRCVCGYTNDDKTGRLGAFSPNPPPGNTKHTCRLSLGRSLESP